MAAPLPPQNVPFLDDNNCVTTPWYLWFSDARKRIGGADDITVAAVGNTTVRITLVGTDGTSRHKDETVA